LISGFLALHEINESHVVFHVEHIGLLTGCVSSLFFCHVVFHVEHALFTKTFTMFHVEH